LLEGLRGLGLLSADAIAGLKIVGARATHREKRALANRARANDVSGARQTRLIWAR